MLLYNSKIKNYVNYKVLKYYFFLYFIKKVHKNLKNTRHFKQMILY